jgi:hypothetical protein
LDVLPACIHCCREFAGVPVNTRRQVQRPVCFRIVHLDALLPHAGGERAKLRHRVGVRRFTVVSRLQITASLNRGNLLGIAAIDLPGSGSATSSPFSRRHS